jgi:hypothetical protein
MLGKSVAPEHSNRRIGAGYREQWMDYREMAA